MQQQQAKCPTVDKWENSRGGGAAGGPALSPLLCPVHPESHTGMLCGETAGDTVTGPTLKLLLGGWEDFSKISRCKKGLYYQETESLFHILFPVKNSSTMGLRNGCPGPLHPQLRA